MKSIGIIAATLAALSTHSFAENPLDPDVLARKQQGETAAWCQANPENAQDAKCPEPLRKAGAACLTRKTYPFLSGFSWEARTADCPTYGWKTYAEKMNNKTMGLCTVGTNGKCFSLGDCEISIVDESYGIIYRKGKCPIYSELLSTQWRGSGEYVILIGGESLSTGDGSTYVKMAYLSP